MAGAYVKCMVILCGCNGTTTHLFEGTFVPTTGMQALQCANNSMLMNLIIISCRL